MPATIAKLAMLIHLLDGGNGPITLEATRKALLWKNYLYKHAKRIYKCGQVGSIELASVLVKKLTSSSLKNLFTVREVLRRGWSGLTDKDLVEDALAELEDAGWVRSMASDTLQGRPTKKYNLNPAVLKK